MKLIGNKVKLFSLSAFALIALATSTSISRSANLGETGEEDNTPIGITQRENDLDDYEDLRPSREPFVDNTEPDTGTLIDHTFEFETMACSGYSRHKDHMCSAISYVTSADFSGNIAAECVDAGTTFSINIESDKAVKVPMIVGINNNNIGGATLGDVLYITNNGKPLYDSSAIIPTEGVPAVGAPQGYFDMVGVESTLSLVEGNNRISFRIVRNEINVDYITLKTSANIVDNTKNSWDTPKYEIIQSPTENQGGTLKIVCGNCGHENATRYLPELTSDVYTVEEEGYIKDYYITLSGQKVKAATIDNHPDKIFPDDKGELVDHIYEFEQAEITGPSQEEDHFCGAKSLVFSLDFGSNFCVEAIEEGTKFTFTINSSERVKVPFDLRMSCQYSGVSPLGNWFVIKNNGDETMANVGNKIPWTDTTADVGGISSYFKMVNAPGTINLVKGENKIEIISKKRGMNIDFFNIKTSATLTNNTTPYFINDNVPNIEVTKAPTYKERGAMKIDCAVGTSEKCSRVFDYLPSFSTEGYIIEPLTNETANYYIEAFDKKIKIGTGEYHPLDIEGAKDNFFEFEKASINGHSQDEKTHYCAANSLVLSPDFSNNFCLECTAENTTFEFDINSDKEVFVNFELNVTNSVAGGKPLSDSFIIKNNGSDKYVNSSYVVPTNGKTPDVGDLSQWFNMVNATGTIKLVKGQNRIEFTTKCTGLNVDYINIKTSATLVDNTVSYWKDTNVPTFEVTKAPTLEEKGEMVLSCPTEGCTFKGGKRTYNYLPTLNDQDYIVKNDGYYLHLFGKDIKIAAK